jgi:CRP-like cAMP-binding protein
MMQSKREWLEELYRERTLVTFKAGEVLPLRPREISVVYRGMVQLLTLHPSGDEVLLGLVGPLMPFGLPLSCLEVYQAVALTSGDLLRLSWDEVQQSPPLAQQVNQQLVSRLQQTEALLALTGQRRVLDRIRSFLILLAREFGRPTPQGIRVEVRLTHQQMASALGTTRVTVTRLIGKLREDNFLRIGRDRRLYILTEEPAAPTPVSLSR